MKVEEDVQSFIMTFWEKREVERRLPRGVAFRNWISYIGAKYHKLHGLVSEQTIPRRTFNAIDSDSSLLSTLSGLKCLKRFSVIDVCPMSRQLLEAMDTNDTHLDHFRFLADVANSWANTWDFIKSSTSILHSL